MNIATVIATAIEILGAIEKYGPVIAAAGGRVGDLLEFVRTHRDAEGLTDAQRAEIETILGTDPTQIRL